MSETTTFTEDSGVYIDTVRPNYQGRLAAKGIPLNPDGRTAAQQAEAKLEWWATIISGQLRLKTFFDQGAKVSGAED